MGHRERLVTSMKLFTTLVLLLIPATTGLNLGLIAGDLKRHSSPLLIKKITKHSPVFINIKSALPKRASALPKLPPKPPPMKLLEKQPTKKVPRSLPPILLPPILPPLLPIIPMLPPLLPGLPLLPILPPLLPSLKAPLKPLRVPILKRSVLKPLGSELKIGKVPPIKLDKGGILKKLLELKKKGSLTTAEYIRFKKLLLK